MKKVLFIGGTGIISSACSRLALQRGYDLYHLNRGQTGGVRAVEGVKQIRADIRDIAAAREALKGMEFDAVVDWISFVPEHLATDLELFRGRVGQFIFISSASAYQKPLIKVPITEETPLENPWWEYSRNKIACEKFLREAREKEHFPVTVVRPSHTYDCTCIPLEGDYTNVARMLAGKPVIVHGDGTSLWTLTNHRDFAKGFVGLLCNRKAIGETYHITSDEALPWNYLYRLTGQAFGAEPKIVHVPSEVIARHNPAIGASLLGDKAHCAIFDNSKIKKLVPDFVCTIPYEAGIAESAAWFKSHPEACRINPKLDAMYDELAAWAVR
jgi:nucleoside-diphosphate-sugar epimerase